MQYVPNITAPSSAQNGEIIEIKTLISHPMFPGKKGDKKGNQPEPAKYIESFEATFDGKTVFKAKLTTDVSANPYLSFYFKATKSGTFVFTWKENNGQPIQTVQHKLTTSG